MEIKEAIKIIKGLIRIAELGYNSNPLSKEGEHSTTEALILAISALEKQEWDRWHSVAKEGNPKESGLYIVIDNSRMDGNKPHTRYFNAYGEKAFWSGWRADEVIAWKEITSEPYTEEEA